MYIRLDECPSCGHTHSSNYKIIEDYANTHESFALSKCSKCTLIYTNPIPDEHNIGKYYDHTDYISHTNKSNNLVNTLYKIIRQYTLKQKLNLVARYTSGKRALDFGCGTGHFLSKLYNTGFSIDGYEPSLEARKAIETDTTIYTHLDEIPAKEEYDFITLWHVLEHIHDLKDTIKKIKKALKTQGYLFIAVPNINSNDSIQYNQYWAALDVPRHLYHFSQESMQHFLRLHKLNLIDTLPMKFDSYYVSMLSETYKTGKRNYVKSIISGYQSNIKAQTTGEYSSLIYVIQK